MESANKMKVLVTGVNGLLGHDVINELCKRGMDGVGSGSAIDYCGIALQVQATHMHYVKMDITNPNEVSTALLSERPDAVIHCAAWTNVDEAEKNENLPAVRAVNVYGTQNIASVCKQLGCKLMYISTDYVFNGQGEKPWEPDCREYAPLNVYGQTKLEGELAVFELLENCFIVRTSWVFGANGNNFVKTMLNLARIHDSVRVVNDQIGTPTYTRDLARLLVDVIETDKYGYYHATNEGGFISWCDFAREVLRQAGLDTKVIPVTTEEYGISKAVRPLNSRLDKSKLEREGFEPLPEWRDAVARYLCELNVMEGGIIVGGGK